MQLIDLNAYPLHQKGLKKELDHAVSTEMVYLFGQTFPWSHEAARQQSWTYPDQLFPALSRLIARHADSDARIIPGLRFPDDVLNACNRNASRRLLDRILEYPEPVWTLLEDAVRDLLGLCDWTSRCALLFGSCQFQLGFFGKKAASLLEESGIELIIIDPGMIVQPPLIIQADNDCMATSERINGLGEQAWRQIRGLREDSFRGINPEEWQLESLAAQIDSLVELAMLYMHQAEPYLDQYWLKKCHVPLISALKEEYALLAARKPFDFLSKQT